MSQTRLLVVISDLHVGSDVGLMPPDAEFGQGNTVGFGRNWAHQWLWECWENARQRISDISDNDSYTLLVNGDATEGIHHGSPEVIAAAIEDHSNMAIRCLDDIASNATKTLVTLGTECHTKAMEHRLAEKLHAETGKARAKWLFRIAGTLVDATHHIGVSSRVHLEATQLSVAMANARLNSLRSGHECAKVFLRGHRHCGGKYDDGESLIGVTGGWQMLTRHGYKVVPDSIPRPSVMILDWRDVPDGSLPIAHRLVYNPPQPEILEV